MQGLATLSNATTSLLTVSNGAWFTNGNIGISTTSPWGLLSINPNGISGPSFVVGSSTATNFVITNSGNTGIGTTSPGSLFSLNNIANFTTATSSFYGNGINLANGCFAINGTCVGSGGSGTINSGTTGQLSYYAGSGTTLTATSSLFIHSNQNIGIGTTTPNWLLQVAGTRPFLTLSDTGAAANNKHWFLSSQGGNFYIGTTTDAYATTSISALTITNGGNVGIATSSPQSALLSVENTGTGYTFYVTDSANDTTPFVIDASGNVGVGTAGPGAILDVLSTVENVASFMGNTDTTITLGKNSGGGTSEKYITYRNADTSTNAWLAGMNDDETYQVWYGAAGELPATGAFLTVLQGGNVGIGTTSPTEQLSVSGRLFVGGTGTSTIQNNLYVMGTLRSTVSYVGDLIFSNNFRFIETPRDAKIQSLFLQNQNGENILKIDENGKVVMKEITAKQGNFEEKLQIGSPQNRTGITIYDKKTGEPVCIFSENNVLKSSKGECR